MVSLPHQPWTPPSTLHPESKYEAMHLAYFTDLFINRSEQDMSAKQKNALQQLCNDPFDDLGVVDASNIPVGRILRILSLVSDLFFFSSLIADFEWKDLANSRRRPGMWTKGLT